MGRSKRCCTEHVYLLKVPAADVVISQRTPELAKLVSKASETSSNNGSHVE